MWILPAGVTPSITRSDSDVEFLLRPDPTFYRDENSTYLRNLDIRVVTLTLSTLYTGVRLDTSTLTPIQDVNEPIYVSQDSWASWQTVSPLTVNIIYPPLVTGSFQVAYRPSTASTVLTVAGVASYTPEFTPLYNAIDEYGETFSLPRLDGEGNTPYTLRIKSKLAAVGSADPAGVSIEVARRLGVMDRAEWNYSRIQGSYLLRIQDLGSGPANQTSLSGATLTAVGADTDWGMRRTCLSTSGSTGSYYYVPWVSGMTGYTGTRLASWAWVNVTAVTPVTQYLLTQGDMSLYSYNGEVRLNLATAATLSASLGTGWHHISFYYVADQLSLGVDGVEQDSTTFNNWTLSSGTWTIGYNLDGRIDELHVSTDVILEHDQYYRQIILTDGWPTLVIGAYGNVPSKGYSTNERLTQRTGGEWRASYPIAEPYLVYEGSRGELDFITSSTLATGYLTLPSWVVEPYADYTIQWWYGVSGVVPDQLPDGRYTVYTARSVLAESFRTYREQFLTDVRGFLTPTGEELVKTLGSKVSWAEMRWDENLYFYEDQPPLAPTPTAWDQYLDYPTLS